MGLFFKDERVVKVEAQKDPTPESLEATLSDLADKKASVMDHTGRKDIVESMYHLVRKVEPLLIAEVSEGRITTLAAARAFVKGIVPAEFPADKMVQIMVDRAGGKVADFVQACKDESGGVVMEVGEVRNGGSK